MAKSFGFKNDVIYKGKLRMSVELNEHYLFASTARESFIHKLFYFK